MKTDLCSKCKKDAVVPGLCSIHYKREGYAHDIKQRILRGECSANLKCQAMPLPGSLLCEHHKIKKEEARLKNKAKRLEKIQLGVCSADGCDVPLSSKTLCQKHLARRAEAVRKTKQKG